MPRIVKPCIYIGVDPGASGGLAMVGQDGDASEEATCKMLPTDQDVWRWFRRWHPPRIVEPFAVIEKVGGYVGSGQPGSAMFKFGQSYGGLRMALTAAQIPFEEVTPQRWQKGLGMTPRAKDESKTEWKNRLKAKAQQLFPDADVTLAIADALLIAEYARRLKCGEFHA